MLAITFQTKKDSLADKWASLLRNILCALFIEDPAGPKDYELLLFFADRRSKEFAKEAKRGKPRLIDVLGRNKGPTIWKKKKTRREKTRKKGKAKTKALGKPIRRRQLLLRRSAFFISKIGLNLLSRYKFRKRKKVQIP